MNLKINDDVKVKDTDIIGKIIKINPEAIKQYTVIWYLNRAKYAYSDYQLDKFYGDVDDVMPKVPTIKENDEVKFDEAGQENTDLSEPVDIDDLFNETQEDD